MARVYVGNLHPRVTERDLEDEFQLFGVLRSVWVARRPPGYAFIEFDERCDALDAIEELDGRNGWRVELSHNSKGSRSSRGNSEDMKCYACGELGHFARECHPRIGHSGLGSRRHYRSPSPRYRLSPSYGYRSYTSYRRSPSPPYGHKYSPNLRSPSPYRRSYSPYHRSYRGRSYSRSPIYRRSYSPYANRSRSRS